MFVIAITGGIGAGKTTATEYFATLGADVLDADTIAKELLEPGRPARQPVVERFGPEILDQGGRIDRRALARIAFADAQAARDLDAIVHPLVTAEIERTLDELAVRAMPPAVVVIDVPLLAEVPALARAVDFVLLITAPEDVRVARAVARGMEESDVRVRLARQLPDEERRRSANAEIVNDGDPARFREELSRLWEREVVTRVS